MWGWVTARTAFTATAASAAEPPAFNASTPASVSSGCAEATMASRPSASGRCEYPTSGTPLSSREESRDLVLGKDRHRTLGRALHQRHPLGPRYDLTDVVTIDALAGERVDDDAGLGRRQGQQQRAGRDGPERVETERAAELDALRQADDAIGVDAKPDAGRVRELGQRGRDAAFRRIVHRVHGGELARDLRFGQDAEPWRAQEALGAADRRGPNAACAQLALALACDDGRTFERNALRHDHRVTDLGAGRRHQPLLVDLPEHRAGHDGTIETVGDLGVTAHQRHL